MAVVSAQAGVGTRESVIPRKVAAKSDLPTVFSSFILFLFWRICALNIMLLSPGVIKLFYFCKIMLHFVKNGWLLPVYATSKIYKYFIS
jgi:hypothetical protein